MEFGGKTFAEGYINYTKWQTWPSKKSVSNWVKSVCTCPGACSEAKQEESPIEDIMLACRQIIEKYNGMGEYEENREILLYCLEKLRKLPLRFCAISATGIDEALCRLVMTTSVTMEAVKLLYRWRAIYIFRQGNRFQLQDPGYESDNESELEPPKFPRVMYLPQFYRWLIKKFPSVMRSLIYDLPIEILNSYVDAPVLLDNADEEGGIANEPRLPLARRRRASEHNADAEAPESDDDSQEGSRERPENPSAEVLEPPRSPEVNVLELQCPDFETSAVECACPPEYCRLCR